VNYLNYFCEVRGGSVLFTLDASEHSEALDFVELVKGETRHFLLHFMEITVYFVGKFLLYSNQQLINESTKVNLA
jgi:hypothetical protein